MLYSFHKTTVKRKKGNGFRFLGMRACGGYGDRSFVASPCYRRKIA